MDHLAKLISLDAKIRKLQTFLGAAGHMSGGSKMSRVIAGVKIIIITPAITRDILVIVNCLDNLHQICPVKCNIKKFQRWLGVNVRNFCDRSAFNLL